MTVLVVNYGMGNLGSVLRALEECGASAFVSDDPTDLAEASAIVLPGVGSFADGMANLHAGGWVDTLTSAVLEDGVPVLGICLGMQLFADFGEEGGRTPGLGWIPGEVIRLTPDTPETRIPHVGWNEVNCQEEAALFENIPPETDFYFVHSYHFRPTNPDHAIATTPYCGGFVSAAGRDRIAGVQFHPEKSSRMGFQLLRNFLES